MERVRKRKSRWEPIDNKESEWRKITFSQESDNDTSEEKVKNFQRKENTVEQKDLSHRSLIPLQQLLQSKVPSASVGCSSFKDCNYMSKIEDVDISPNEAGLNMSICGKDKNNKAGLNSKKVSGTDLISKNDVNITPSKKTIVLSKCVLCPPKPTDFISKTHGKKYEKCNAVFINNLPNKITEEVIEQIFGQCGKMISVWLIGQDCHIRFASEESVYQAIQFSGYKLFVKNRDDSDYISTMYVNYAKPNMCDLSPEERFAARYKLHARSNEDYNFSYRRAKRLFETLKCEEDFIDGIPVLITWLKKGECKKDNNQRFYSLIECLIIHSQRLTKETIAVKKSYIDAIAPTLQKINVISLQLSEICKLFDLVKSKEIWCNFKKYQKKNLKSWRHIGKEIEKVYYQELIEDRIEEEMEVSDQEDEVIQLDKNSFDIFEDEIFERRNYFTDTDYNRDPPHSFVNDQGIERDIICNNRNYVEKSSDVLSSDGENVGSIYNCYDAIESEKTCSVSQQEMRLIILISTFLTVCPFGSNVKSICEYLIKDKPLISEADVKSLLRKFPDMFKEECSVTGEILFRSLLYG